MYLERIHLEIIRAVDQKGSMTAAAEALHLTQSALSHSMRKLENILDVKLWDRVGRQLKLTQAGMHLLETADRLIPQMMRTEERLQQFAKGECGTLRIGMECHPCYRWLQKITASYLHDWPLVDLDVKQAFQFSGLRALQNHEIDLLVTPDPCHEEGLHFESVFDYEQVLVVGNEHPLKAEEYIIPRQLGDEVLFTYPVSANRLDIYNHFLNPAGMSIRKQKVVETTEMMLQLVACGRGIAALPRWLVEEYAVTYPISAVRLGKTGLAKQIFIGIRQDDMAINYLKAFVNSALSFSAGDQINSPSE
tara:strand:- start:3776 stop:4693 length:918 start_codon:yes stop_codon:yes gene_type:complete